VVVLAVVVVEGAVDFTLQLQPASTTRSKATITTGDRRMVGMVGMVVSFHGESSSMPRSSCSVSRQLSVLSVGVDHTDA